MKKTLSVLAVLGVVTFGLQSAEAFCWSSLNPAYWGHCPKCEKPKKECGCQKKCDPCQKIAPKCDPCETGAAAPCETPKKQDCNPCKKTENCDPCQKVQPCNPCTKSQTSTPVQNSMNKTCDPCDKLQNMNK